MNLEETGAAVELVSQAYAAKFGIDCTDVWFLLKLQEELGELTQAFVNLKGMSKDRGQSDADKRTAFAVRRRGRTRAFAGPQRGCEVRGRDRG